MLEWCPFVFFPGPTLVSRGRSSKGKRFCMEMGRRGDDKFLKEKLTSFVPLPFESLLAGLIDHRFKFRRR